MSTNVPMYGFCSGGGKGAALTVTAPAGSTVTVSKDGKSKTKVAGYDGIVVFKGLQSGTWMLSITDGTQTASKTLEIVADYAAEISYNVIPEFTYTGDYEIVNDTDETITVSQDNWKIRLLTSGILTFQELNGAENGIDVFLVGGGGSTTGSNPEAGSIDMRGGGGGGYTTTKKGVPVNSGTPYDIVVGAGASDGAGDGGTSTAFGQSAAGGSGTITVRYGGCAGGSGGGGYANVDTTNYTTVGHGGSDGGDGYPSNNKQTGGIGQGTTTREFGESGGKIYAGGGGGSTYSQWTSATLPGGLGGDGGGGRGGNTSCAPTPGEPNTGGGGGGGIRTCAAGGSGIVVIRNKR